MSRKVQSADGVIHEFPDGTPDTAIDKAMKEYAKTNVTEPVKPKNPFMGQSVEQLNKAYANHKFMGNKDLLPLIADARAKAEMDAGGFPYALGDSVRQFAKGIPIAGGLIDEGMAGASSLLGGNYEDTLEAERARDRARHEANPETALGMNLFGGVAGTVAAAPAVGMGSLGVGATRPLAQTALRGAAIGLPVGAADGFTRGEGGLEGRTESALIGGGLGLLGGAVAPVIGQGLASGYANVRNALSRAASLRGTGMDPKVAGVLAETLEGDDALGQALARIREGGDNAMLVDAGPNAAGALDTTIQMGGPQSARLAAAAVEDRVSSQSKEFTQALDKNFGPAVGSTARKASIREGYAPELKQLYDKAYETPIDYTSPAGERLQRLFSSERIPKEAWSYANQLMREEGATSKQILFKVADDGTIQFERMPDVRQLDYVKQALDDLAWQNPQGVMGGASRLQRARRSTVRELRDALGQAVKEYDTAVRSANDPITQQKAIDYGRQVLSPTYTRDEMVIDLADMTKKQREAAARGLRDFIDDVVANVKQRAYEPDVDALELRKGLEMVTSKAARAKVGQLLNDPKKTLEFYTKVGQAMRALELKAQVATNSRTAGRQATGQRMGDAFEPGPVGTAMQGEAPKALKQMIQMATGATKNQQRQAMNERWLSLARALTGPRGRDAEALFRRLIAANRVRGQNALAGQRLGILGAGTVAGTQPTVNSRLFSE